MTNVERVLVWGIVLYILMPDIERTLKMIFDFVILMTLASSGHGAPVFITPATGV